MKRNIKQFSVRVILATAVLLLRFVPPLMGAEIPVPPREQASAVVDLATAEGAKLVKGQWRYSDTKIVETDFLVPGADGQPSKTPAKTYDYTPHAGGTDFDDSKWQAIAPNTLSQRRGPGRL